MKCEVIEYSHLLLALEVKVVKFVPVAWQLQYSTLRETTTVSLAYIFLPHLNIQSLSFFTKQCDFSA